jgi:cysteine desulfurase
MKLPIYMDNHATTPVDPRVVDAMFPCFTEYFGNASSLNHAYGWEAEKLVDKARIQVAEFLGSSNPSEIIFTSGATESNKLAFKGIVEVYREKGNHVITQVTEHKCILDTCKFLEKHGIRVTFLGVDQYGQIRMDELKKAITDQTLLISIMYANNEIGTLQRISEMGALAHERGVFFHVDAAQAAGKLPIHVEHMNIDLLSLSAHKMYGPKGTGALYLRSKNPRVRVEPLLHGGGHERGLRSGTLNVPGIVGFAKACEIAKKEMTMEYSRILALREKLRNGIERGLEGVFLNGHPTERLPGNLNVSFAGIDSDAFLSALDQEVAVSSGSACNTQNLEPSYVLKALNLPMERMKSSIRFGLGRFNTEEEVDYVIDRVITTVKRLRSQSPMNAV